MIRKTILIFICSWNVLFLFSTQQEITLSNDLFKIVWVKTPKIWIIKNTVVKCEEKEVIENECSGSQTIIFTEVKPGNSPKYSFLTNKGVEFPENKFRYPKQTWESNLTDVCLNTAGIKQIVNAQKLVCKSPITFSATTNLGIITSIWTIDKNTIKVRQTFKAAKTGFFSLSTPTVFSTKPNEQIRAVVPGYLNAESMSSDFVSAYAYGFFIPDRPVIYRDRCATTPISILEKNYYTVGVVPEEKYPRKPHNNIKNTHSNWNVGLSSMNPQAIISPTLYYPVLGQEKSFMKQGDELTFEYRYIISRGDWYDVFKQAVYDVFKFDKQKIIENKQPLIGRVFQMYKYLTDTKTSRFRIKDCEQSLIGAQDYLGGVADSDKDATKNSDYGAMWMLGTLTQDTLLTKVVLPYARNFKLKQIYTEGKFKGAVKGQYYLWKSKSWAEEWGQYIEPIGVVYYALADMGNILLFNPNDTELKHNFKLAAEYLFKNQLSDGSWDVGYEKVNNETIYTDLKDLRPTFYGMLIAYDILKEKRYLDAAIRGGDWFIEYAVNTGQFIGVCGDTRFSPDFATSQSVQALYELYKATGNVKYKNAAIRAARFYTTYIYTYPNGQTDMQTQQKQTLPGWGFSQSGLCFEHAGTIGSSNSRGPILLASHAGMFVRMFQLSNDSLFIDMARAAANGKDGFVDKATGVASYYWDSFDQGAGSFPHHAWWQIGWIMDYLMSEAELRSNGAISFPRGFITPKVGPHQTIGFAPGLLFGKKVHLILVPDLIITDNVLCEYLTVVSDSTLYILTMNSSSKPIEVKISVGKTIQNLNNAWKKDFETIKLMPYGLQILKVEKQVTTQHPNKFDNNQPFN